MGSRTDSFFLTMVPAVFLLLSGCNPLGSNDSEGSAGKGEAEDEGLSGPVTELGGAAGDLGAGSYRVFVGSAFYLEELMDRSQWAYVADTADGLFDHPVGHQNKPGYRNITAKQWQALAAHFASRDVLVEGDMLDGNPAGDLGSIQRAKGLGLRPLAALVNRIPANALDAWNQRIALNLAEGVESHTMLAPHRMETAPGGFQNADYEQARHYLLRGAGTSVDAPTSLFVNRTEKYRQSIYDATAFAHQQGKKFTYLISPNVSGDRFLEHAQQLVRTLEDADREPDFYGVELYGLRPYHLVPDSVAGSGGIRVSANTITGVAHWLLRHARADEGELDLWAHAAGGGEIGRGVTQEDPTEAEQTSLSGWAPGPNGDFQLTLNVTNESDWLDFVPWLTIEVSGLPSGWKLGFTVNGNDVTDQILRGGGYKLYRQERLWPRTTRQVMVTLSKAGATRAPDSLAMVFALSPHQGSRFVRDVVVFKGAPRVSEKRWTFDADTEQWRALHAVSGLSWLQGGRIRGTITGLDAYIASGLNPNVDIRASKRIRIRMKNESESRYGQIYFTTDADPRFGDQKSKTFALRPNDPDFTEYELDMSDVNSWTGVLRQLRIDVCNGVSSGAFVLDSVSIGQR